MAMPILLPVVCGSGPQEGQFTISTTDWHDDGPRRTVLAITGLVREPGDSAEDPFREIHFFVVFRHPSALDRTSRGGSTSHGRFESRFQIHWPLLPESPTVDLVFDRRACRIHIAGESYRMDTRSVLVVDMTAKAISRIRVVKTPDPPQEGSVCDQVDAALGPWPE
jgi:hypothetical protein